MNWITPQIAIGDFYDAERPSAEVDTILCLRPRCGCDQRARPPAFPVPLVDGPGNSAAALADALRFLMREVDTGRRVLVHCRAGRSRSVVIVARYLMEREGIDRATALAFINSKREYFLSPGIAELFDLPLRT